MKNFIALFALLLISATSRADVIAFARADFNSSMTNRMSIYTMSSDGTNQTRLAASIPSNYMPYSRLMAVSPDGSRIAYSFFTEAGKCDIHIINIVNGQDIQITSGSFDDVDLRWSPDGTKLVFRRTDFGDQYFCIVNSDGTNLTRIQPDTTSNAPTGIARQATFSPDGNRLVFAGSNSESIQSGPYTYDIYTMNLDGSDIKRITYLRSLIHGVTWGPGRIYFIDRLFAGNVFSVDENGNDLKQITNTGADLDIAISPTGNELVIMSSRDGGNTGNIEIYSSNIDGSSVKRLTNTPDSEYYPTWGSGTAPVPTPTPTATPLPNAVPIVSFQSPQRGSRFANGDPFEVRVEASDADGNDDIRRVSLSVQRGSDGYYWNGTSWGSTSVELSLAPGMAGQTYDAELNFGARTYPDHYILTAYARDKRETSGTAITAVQLVDRIAPSVTILQPAQLSRISSLPAISGTVSDTVNSASVLSSAQRVVISLRRGSDGKYWTGSRWSVAYTLLAASITKYGWKCNARLPQGSDLSSGPFYISATAYDISGNRSSATNTVYVQASTSPPGTSTDGLSIITTDSATGSIRIRYVAPLITGSATDTANYAVQLGTLRVPVEAIRYENGVVTLLVGADALPSGEPVTVTWRNLQRATGGGSFAGQTTVSVR